MNKKAALITIAIVVLVLLFVFLVISYIKVAVLIIIGIAFIGGTYSLYKSICEELDDNDY